MNGARSFELHEISNRMTLADVHAVFQQWLGAEYDLATLDAMLAVAAAERLPGDPAWLLIISGSGNAKTETVQSTNGLGAMVVSTIISDAALLSGTPKRDQERGATGGLLRQIGERGVLAIKDFTSILSADRNVRPAILAALREVHDGRWSRHIGVGGGKTLEWRGRLVVIGACTTAWDTAHGVIASMGDRFLLIRSDSSKGRIASGLQAMNNTGQEEQMRAELAAAVESLINQVDPNRCYRPTDDDKRLIVAAANLVALARTGVEVDYRGDVINAHAPEMPTRLAKQLTQVLRGAIAIGMSREAAMNLVIRCAQDSMPPLRLDVLRDVADHPLARVIDIRRRLQKPRTTVDRTLQALHMLGLLICDEEEEEKGKRTVNVRHYSLTPGHELKPLDIPFPNA